MSTTISPSAGKPAAHRVIRAPRGTQLSCKGWQPEAARRMLMNNLDPDVAEKPDPLIDPPRLLTGSAPAQAGRSVLVNRSE